MDRVARLGGYARVGTRLLVLLGQDRLGAARYQGMEPNRYFDFGRPPYTPPKWFDNGHNGSIVFNFERLLADLCRYPSGVEGLLRRRTNSMVSLAPFCS